MAFPKVIVECVVCREVYDDQNLCPRMLKCGHSFCTRCLWQLLTADDKIPCPTCRVEVNVPQGGVAGLPKNFALLSILDVKPQQQEESESLFTCEVCDDKHLAIFWCFNCKEDMCKVAAHFHIRHKASNRHALLSLESATASASCSKHSEPFRLFDNTCGHMVCRRCIKLDHKGHNFSSFADAALKCRQEVQELATKVNTRSEEIKTAEAQVKQAMLDMENSRKKQKARIHSLFKEMHDALNAKEQILTNKLEELHNNKAAILAEQQDRLHKFQESAANFSSLIGSSRAADLLVARSALQAMLRDTENQSMLLEPEVQFVPKLIFNRRRLQDLVDALNNEAGVIDDLTCAENTIARGRGLNLAIVGLESSFTIIAHDAQKRRRTLGGDLFMVELQDESGNKKATGNIEDRGDGSYLVSYTVPATSLPTVPSRYKLVVRFRGAHIQGSPRPFSVKFFSTAEQYLQQFFVSLQARGVGTVLCKT